MTDLELKQAKIEYKMQLEGQRKMLECLANPAVSSFTKQHFSNVSEESISSISEDEILRNAFLSTFHDTKESSDLMVWINYIQRIDDKISDGQPVLESVDWTKKSISPSEPLKLYNLYCNLETNEPVLINQEERERFSDGHQIIWLPNYSPITETYHYNSTSLEWISKGSATMAFEQLQLYYYRELLENSREEAIKKVKYLKA